MQDRCMTTMTDPLPMAVGLADEDWTGDARFFEYHQAVDPLRAGTIPPVPIERFAAAPAGVTGVFPLDLSAAPGTPWPAAGAAVRLEPVATSELFYVVRGTGRTVLDGGVIRWEAGDVVVLPAGVGAEHEAAVDATLYHVSDAPLLAYLGVRPARARFAPTVFRHGRLAAELDRVASAPGAAGRNRISVL